MDLTATSIKPIEGLRAYMPNQPQLHNVVFTSGTSTDVTSAGQVVALNTSSTNIDCPEVVACPANGDPFGVVVYDVRREHAKVGEKIAIAQSGDVVFMVAGGAVAVGAKLQFNASTRKVDDTTTSGGAFIGKALTVASADGDLIQVELNFDLGKQST